MEARHAMMRIFPLPSITEAKEEGKDTDDSRDGNTNLEEEKSIL